jgi:hypothetical protein
VLFIHYIVIILIFVCIGAMLTHLVTSGIVAIAAVVVPFFYFAFCSCLL